MTGYIYKIENKINGKIYIGKTIQGFDKRYSNNIAKYTQNKHLKYSFEKYGIENFDISKEFEIVEYNSVEELNQREMYWIKFYNSSDSNFGYNKTLGGDGMIPNEETRVKMREAKINCPKGEDSPIYGMKRSEKSKQLMSKIRKDNIEKNGFNIRENIDWDDVWVKVKEKNKKERCIRLLDYLYISTDRSGFSRFTIGHFLESINQNVKNKNSDKYIDVIELLIDLNIIELINIGSCEEITARKFIIIEIKIDYSSFFTNFNNDSKELVDTFNNLKNYLFDKLEK